jgi:transposase
MDATQRLEMIRPILNGDKTVEQVAETVAISARTLHRYLKRFREGGQKIEALADKSSAAHSHPKWLTEEQKAIVLEYKRQNPPISARQIAKDLAAEGILDISYRTVSNILNGNPFFSP